MRKFHVYRISVLILLFIIAAALYSYLIFRLDVSNIAAVFFMAFFWVCTAFVFLFLRKFLKQFLNFKDKSNLTLIIVVAEFFQHVIMLIIVNEYIDKRLYELILNAMQLFISVILAITYILFAAKIIGFSHSQARKLIPFAYIIIIGQVLLLIILLYFNYAGDTVMTAAKTDLKTFIMLIGKMAMFAVLPYVFIKGYKRRRY